MIKNPEVFVLVAGTSMPYGYPSGEHPKNQILKNLRKEEITDCYQMR